MTGKHHRKKPKRHNKPSEISQATLGIAGATTIAVSSTVSVAHATTPSNNSVPSASDSAWDKLAECESGGDWQIDTGNGYKGGLQFASSTWNAFGGKEFAPSANLATKEEQIVVAERTLAAQGWNAWPACSRKVGVRGEAATVRVAPQLTDSAERGARPAPAPPTPDQPQDSPPNPPSSPNSPTGDTYVVKRGDTLANITPDWRNVAKLNNISNPNRIFVGQVLKLTPQAPQATPTTPPTQAGIKLRILPPNTPLPPPQPYPLPTTPQQPTQPNPEDDAKPRTPPPQPAKTPQQALEDKMSECSESRNEQGFGAVKRHVARIGSELRCRFDIDTVIGRGSRGIGGSDHPKGLALDFMTARGPGDKLANYAVANMDDLRISYVIWRQRINFGNGWKGMEDRGNNTANHFDHVHISFKS